jgi:hypothetical protein
MLGTFWRSSQRCGSNAESKISLLGTLFWRSYFRAVRHDERGFSRLKWLGTDGDDNTAPGCRHRTAGPRLPRTCLRRGGRHANRCLAARRPTRGGAGCGLETVCRHHQGARGAAGRLASDAVRRAGADRRGWCRASAALPAQPAPERSTRRQRTGRACASGGCGRSGALPRRPDGRVPNLAAHQSTPLDLLPGRYRLRSGCSYADRPSLQGRTTAARGQRASGPTERARRIGCDALGTIAREDPWTGGGGSRGWS